MSTANAVHEHVVSIQTLQGMHL